MRPLSNFVIRHSKLSLFGFIALVLLSLIGGFQAFGNLKGGGYNDPGSDSEKVMQMLTKDFGQSDPEVVVVADMGRSADDAESAASGEQIAAELAKTEGVSKVTSYYSLGRAATLKSTDGKAVYFFAKLEEGSKTAEVSKDIQDRFTGENYGATIYVAGWGPITSEINHTIESDLTRAESVAIPITLLLMIFVFGSVVAAGLPLMIAGLTILGSFFFIWLASLFTDTSTFSVNLVTGLGLGLGIDYALLMVSRFREERAKKQDLTPYLIEIARENCIDGNKVRAGDAVNFSIGQGDTLVTPLRLAQIYSAIANNGTYYKPQVARAIVDVDGKVIKEFKPVIADTVKVEQSTWDFLHRALHMVVTRGTAASVFSGFPVAISGKTGTAQVFGKNPNGSAKDDTSWFASYGPTEDPKYAVVMMVSQGGFGASASGVGVRDIYATLFGVSGNRVNPDKAIFPTGVPTNIAKVDLKKVANKVDLTGIKVSGVKLK